MPQTIKGPGLDEETRAQIAESLFPAIGKAMRSYGKFIHDDHLVDAKTFGAYHTACKAGVAHITLLLKLADWAQLPRKGQDEDLALLMNEAQAELNLYRGDDA